MQKRFWKWHWCPFLTKQEHNVERRTKRRKNTMRLVEPYTYACLTDKWGLRVPAWYYLLAEPHQRCCHDSSCDVAEQWSHEATGCQHATESAEQIAKWRLMSKPPQNHCLTVRCISVPTSEGSVLRFLLPTHASENPIMRSHEPFTKESGAISFFQVTSNTAWKTVFI